MAIAIERGSCDAANLTRGRPLGLRPEAIVLHSAMGSINGLQAQCNDPSSSVSTHYGIGEDGSVRQFVDDTDTAYHAGIIDRPQWRGLKPNVNPNYYTLGVSFAGTPLRAVTDRQHAAGAELIATVCDRWRIPVDADHIVSHQQIRASKDCPGGALRIADLIADATRIPVAGQGTVALAMTIRTVIDANLRAGSPSSVAPIARALEAGTDISVVGHTSGERVAGNDRWYADGFGNYLWAGATDVPIPTAAAGVSTDAMELGGHPAADTMKIDRTRFRFPEGQYIRELTNKDMIVLHFTAGQTARSAFETWTGNAERVGAAYIVDTDGAVYETFDPAYWAYHLGIKGTWKHDRRSIAIEIANVGPLKLGADESLNWWPPQEQYSTRYCSLTEEQRYVKRRYRNFDYYAAFPDVQSAAVAQLVDYLCERFGIRKAFADDARRAECDPEYFETFKGIATHANFRRDKYDVGPAFDWRPLTG